MSRTPRRRSNAGGIYRKFDGKRYYLFSRHGTKTRAKERAKELRNDGKKARVVKQGSQWEVFMQG